MSITVKAPRLGEGVNELTIGRWLVRAGEKVLENAPLVELESDKVVTELVSPAAGTLLKTFVMEGDVVRVGDPVALIGRADEAVVGNGSAAGPALRVEMELPSPAGASAARGTGPQSVTSPQSAAYTQPAVGTELRSLSTPSNRFLSPLARKLCALHEVDPSTITGTGLGGRVMKQDILDFVAARAQAAPLPDPRPDPSPLQAVLRPHSNARARIAVRMMEAMRSSAQVLTVMEADLGAVMAHRAANKESFAREGLKLTLTAYFLATTAAALRKHPTVNSSWSDEGLLIHPTVDIGMAVSLGEEGLLVPVIRKADTLSLKELSRAVEDLASRSRSRKLTPDEVRGGTFSLTNHGSSGSLFATPILVHGQAGILGVGMVQKRVVVVETPGGADAIAIRPMAYLSFVFDHRVMDGEGADRFLADVVTGLETWR
jgi:2-oxoglutarate dehydrogenase E2 component (dihydrolipoamide succinyltransferase)